MTEETNPKDESTKVSQDVIAWFYLVDIVGRFFDLLMICEMCGPYMSIEIEHQEIFGFFVFVFVLGPCHRVRLSPFSCLIPYQIHIYIYVSTYLTICIISRLLLRRKLEKEQLLQQLQQQHQQQPKLPVVVKKRNYPKVN